MTLKVECRKNYLQMIPHLAEETVLIEALGGSEYLWSTQFERRYQVLAVTTVEKDSDH